MLAGLLDRCQLCVVTFHDRFRRTTTSSRSRTTAAPTWLDWMVRSARPLLSLARTRLITTTSTNVDPLPLSHRLLAISVNMWVESRTIKVVVW